MDAVKQMGMWVFVAAVSVLSPGYAASPPGNIVRVTLSGSQEIPPVTTSASGIGVVVVGADKSISGSVTTSGVVVTAAHIHEAPPGQNGGIVINLVKTSENVWPITPGAKLSDAQYEAYKAGNLYFNIHSAANRGGEIRGQIKP